MPNAIARIAPLFVIRCSPSRPISIDISATLTCIAHYFFTISLVPPGWLPVQAVNLGVWGPAVQGYDTHLWSGLEQQRAPKIATCL